MQTAENIMIAEDGDESKLGLQVHWRLSGEISQEALHNALYAIGLQEKHFPMDVSDTTVLKRAMQSIRSGSRELVRSLSKNGGYSLVTENEQELDLDTHADGQDHKSHNVEITAKLVKDGNSSYIKVTPANHPLESLLRHEFNRLKGVYECSSDLSAWLTQKIIPLCNGLSGRERGGFYYIPAGEDVAKFNEIAAAVESLSFWRGAHRRLTNGVKFYKIPAAMGEAVVEAVLDSLIDECDKTCDTIAERIEDHNTNTCTLRKKGLKAQQDRAKYMRNKINKYAGLLGESLDDLKTRVEEVEAAIVTAELSLIEKL